MQKESLARITLLFFIGLILSAWLMPSEQKSAGEFSAQDALNTENEAVEQSKTWSGDSYRRAVDLFREASEKWVRLGQPARAADCRRRAAQLYFYLADYKNAEASVLEAIQADAAANDLSGKARSYSLLSFFYLETGEAKKSEEFYRKALDTAKTSGDPAARAAALLSAAEYSYYHRDPDTTVNLFEEARALAEQSGDTKLEAQILQSLTYAYSKQGNPVLALKTAQSSLLKWQEISDARGQATTLTAMGLAYKMLDESQSALDVHQRAEALFPPDMDLIERARLSTGIASIYSVYNEERITQIYLKKAYDLYGEADYAAGRLAVLPSLIKSYLSTGNKDLAEQYYAEVESLSERFKNDLFLGYAHEVVGSEKLKSGSGEEAVTHFRQALRTFQKFKNKRGTALLYQRLGEAYKQIGDHAAAAKHFQLSLDINRQIKDRFSESETLYQLADLSALREESEKALELVKNSIELTEGLYSNILNSKLKSTYFSNVFDRYELYITLLMQMHKRLPGEGYALQALQAAEKSRARSMLETLQLSGARFTKDVEPALVEREKEMRMLLNLKADKLTDLLSKNAEQAEIEKLDREINELKYDWEKIKAELKVKSPVYSTLKNPALFDVADFQQRVLDDRTLLLEFSLGEKESYLWVVDKTGVSVYTLPPRRQIEARVHRLRELLGAREQTGVETIEEYQTRLALAESEYQTEALALSRELFGPTAEKITGKRLILVPDGKLHYFPMAALPVPGQETAEPILSRNEIVYEPSAALLSLLRTEARAEDPPKNLLVFADPISSQSDARIRPGDRPANDETPEMARLESFRFAESLAALPRLAESRAEADAVARIAGASGSDVFLGSEANLQNVLDRRISDYKIIHFASHGFIAEERPELSAIVLSQFNEQGQKQDGLLRIHHIYGLNLNADLVVLSACNTGVGKEVRGDGLQSLNNAFLTVGARSVVSTLWKVDDSATRELMKYFYEALASGNVTAPAALRQAQLKLQENPQYRSPFYWAAFTIQGDFQSAPRISGGFESWIYLLLLAPVLIFAAYRLRRFYSTTRP